MKEVTGMLSAVEQGDSHAAEQLLPLVHEELRRLAAVRIVQEPPGQTLQATALVHEAYARLVDVDQTQRWKSRGHFFGAAAEAMRRILVEQARRKKAEKRGGRADRQELQESWIAAPQPEEDVLAVDEALDHLAVADPVAARLVQLRFFAGLNMQEAAAVMGMSVRSAHDVWAYARSWLHRRLRPD